jgi:hypothetical protein
MNYNINDFGLARFKIKRKGYIITGFTGHGTITDMDKNNIEFTDNDGFQFIVPKELFEFKSEDKQ